jgi:phosphate transport system protein
MRARLDADLQRMGSLVGGLLVQAINALQRRDAVEAAGVPEGDERADWMHVCIERQCLALLETRRPEASDLRGLALLLGVSTDLERIGDHAKSIAEAATRLCLRTPVELPADIPYMGQMVRGMLHDALEALLKRGGVLAEALKAKDAAVDAMQARVSSELLGWIQHPRTAAQALDLMMVVHHLRRAAGRATSIATRVTSMIAGEVPEPDASMTSPAE